MSRSGRESTLAERVAVVRRRLATAFCVDAALIALSGADLGTLRELEWQLSGCGRIRSFSSQEALRVFLAEAHVKIKRGKKLMSTRKVTAAVVQRWALETIHVWLPGYTDFDDELGGQFKIIYMGPHGSSGLADKYTVATIDGLDPRPFRLTVAVLSENPE